MTKKGYNKIENLMTPWAGVLLLRRDHKSLYSEYTAPWLLLCSGIMMLISNLFYDWAVDIQI